MSDTIIDGIRKNQIWVPDNASSAEFEASLSQSISDGVHPRPHIVVLDSVVAIDCNIPPFPSDIELLERAGYCDDPRDKFILPPNEFKLYHDMALGCPERRGSIMCSPGGTGLNMAVAISRLAQANADILFLGAVPDGDADLYQLVHQALDDANIRQLENNTGHHLRPAISLIYKTPKKKIVLKSAVENIDEFVNPGIMERPQVQQACRDADLFLTTLNTRIVSPGLVDRIFEERWRRGAMSAATLPTDSECAHHDAELIKFFLPSFSVLLGNETEVKHVFGDGPLPEIFERIVRDLSAGVSNKYCPGMRDPVAFITLGEDGACAITPKGWKHYPAFPNPIIVNRTGVGDHSFGAFLRGYLGGLPLNQCVLGSQALGWAALGIEATHHPKPLDGIALTSRELAEAYAGIGKCQQPSSPFVGAQRFAACNL